VIRNQRPFRSRWDVPTGGSFRLWRAVSPAQLFVGSFVLLIVLGTLGLKLLPGLYTGPGLNWLDAVFTATSAVCVTGLIVVDTATYFTPAGQAFLLLLIQLGGLGMLTLTSLIIVALRRRLTLRQEALYSPSVDVAPQVKVRGLVLDVVRFTLIIEAVGALLLFLLWGPRLGWTEAVWQAVFHSVSAFCNAGFSINTDSLVGDQQSPIVLSVVMLLIVLGGLGFLTLEELSLRWKKDPRQRVARLSLHSHLVLSSTAVLLILSWGAFAAFEWNQTLGGLSVPHKLSNSLFMSVTSRTAGFNTLDYAEVGHASSFLTIILMMIGGSPGSTAGGMKTTTFCLIGLLAWSRFFGYSQTVAWRRSVREETTDRAVGLLVTLVGLVTVGIFVLTVSETPGDRHAPFLTTVFEVVSAVNTVGLSMGLTPELSSFGRGVTIFLMFFGRVGPLTLAAAFAVRNISGAGFRYAYEEVVVG
jgi:trk system potassium uptake protein